METKIITLLEDVCHNLTASGQAYKDYLENGKTFFYAKELMKYNSAIRADLSGNKEILPGSLQQDAEELLFHYTMWTEKWLALEKELNPADGDLFVFQNTHTFPRQAARNMEQTLKELKKQG